MIVFKTYWQLLKKNLPLVILYSAVLIGFSVANMKTNEKTMNFVADKPDVLLVNGDTDTSMTKHLITYLKENTNLTVSTSPDENQINDALFYRDVNYVIYIPKNYSADFLADKNPEIKVKSTGDYLASLAEMILSRYLNVAGIYQKKVANETELLHSIDQSLSQKVDIHMTSTLDTNQLAKATSYYNFASYSILACLIFIISLMLNHFNSQHVKKRRLISPMSEKQHNRILFLTNSLYALVIWLSYSALSFLLVGDTLLSPHGIIYLVNAFVLTICATSIAFFIGTIVRNQKAISGIVNVVALGSSFLCGAFVPMDFLPKSVLKIAHAIPTYYYVKTNEIVKTLESFQFDTLIPIFNNMLIILGFTILFTILTQLISKKRRKIG